MAKISSIVPNAEETSTQAREGLVRTVAFHLPQFHPIPENDEWWGHIIGPQRLPEAFADLSLRRFPNRTIDCSKDRYAYNRLLLTEQFYRPSQSMNTF